MCGTVEDRWGWLRSAASGARRDAEPDGHPFGQGCEFEDRDSGFVLFNCRKGGPANRTDDGFGMVEEDERVIRPTAAGPKDILRVPLKRWEVYSAALVSADGREYLVLLRDKLKVEIYRLG